MNTGEQIYERKASVVRACRSGLCYNNMTLISQYDVATTIGRGSSNVTLL